MGQVVRRVLDVRRLLAVAALLIATAVGTRAEDAPPAAPPVSPPAAPPVAPPAAPPAPATRRALDPKEQEELVLILKGYLNLDNPDAGRSRLQLIKLADTLKKAGADILADHDRLLSAIYPARPFAPYFEKKLIVGKDKDADIVFDSSLNMVNVKWGERRLSLSLPPGYTDAAKAKKLNERAPFPMIVTLHELQPDFQDPKTGVNKEWPGVEVIKRLWDRKAWKAVVDNSIIFAPVAPRARFVEDGKLKLERVWLADIWSRYHVDFDRFVLDGSSDAVAFACSQPNFYAGLIIRARGGKPVELPCPSLVTNLTSLAVFVDGPEDAPIVKALRDGKFPEARLTIGGPEKLAEWLASKSLRREVPKSFHWTVRDPDAHSFAHWINIEEVDRTVELPTMGVECVDTPADPNTVQITTNGIRSITVCLSDQVVDLDREVRVVVNGTPLREARVPTPKQTDGKVVKMPTKFEALLGRTVDSTLDGSVLSARKTQYYTWLWPVTLLKIPIRTDANAPPKDPPPTPPAAGPANPADAPTPPPVPTAAPSDPADAERGEREAQQYYTKAEEKEKAGAKEKAIELYRKARDVGTWTKVYAAAEAKLLFLEAGK